MTRFSFQNLSERILAFIRRAPRRHVAAAGVLLLPAVWWWHESSLPAQLMKAERQQYPKGARECLMLGSNTGINFRIPESMAAWFERTDITDPTAHPFVFYAGPLQNVSDLVVDLERRGLLVRHDMTMTVDQTSSTIGPQSRTTGGTYYHPESYHNTFHHIPVVIYTTRRNDERFQYELKVKDNLFWGRPILPVRTYDTPLPEAGHYTIPLTSPYMVSIATSACMRMKIQTITDIRPRTDLRTGNQLYDAKVTFKVNKLPDWMDTPIFRRTVGFPDRLATGSKVERATVFQLYHGKPVFQVDFVR
ncbi:hypothetical protein AZ09_13910 [Acetobacter aceti 1023]|nr:hypothetical protein AZ09_13910 [Acetobacter aceti 1023]